MLKYLLLKVTIGKEHTQGSKTQGQREYKSEKGKKKEQKKVWEESHKTNDNKGKGKEEEESETDERWDENEEPENEFEEEGDEQEEGEEDDINVDEIDSGEEKISKMEECWQGLSSPTIEKQLIDKWHACIFLHNKSAGLYIGRMKKRFLNDEGGMVLALELDCLEHKLGFADNILQEAKRKDVDVYPVKDIICEPLQMNPLKGGCWEYPSYEIVTKHFEEVKKLGRHLLYNNFVCNEISGSLQ